MTRTAWVIGATGLLGQAVTHRLQSTAGYRVIAEPLSWNDPKAFAQQVSTNLGAIAAAKSPWEIYWCAGAGIVGTKPEALAAESEQFVRFLHQLESHVAQFGPDGVFFYASSAGGVYAGSANPPFTELTTPVAISAYGHAKLAAEASIEQFVSRTGVRALIGRIANLYGAGQRIEKAQGLISQLCRGLSDPRPTSIYVSLDTLRDYISAEDCSGLIVDSVARLGSNSEENRSQPVVKVLASGQAVTIGAILGIFRSMFKRRPNAMIGTSPNSAFQVRDLRLRSVVWPDLDDRPMTPLPVGINTIARSMHLSSAVEAP
jgi:UDP-glucose 4-epimerase